MKKLFKPSNKPQRPYIKNAIIFAIFVSTFFLADWLTKTYIFDFDFATMTSNNNTDWVVVGFRSLPNFSTTFLSFVNASMPGWTYDLIDMSLVAIFSISVFFSRHALSAIGLSIILAGVMGNGFDMLVNNYVRDIIYTPWLDKGTFNFADMFIICGAVVTFVSLVLQMIHDFKKDKTHASKVA